MFFFVLTTLYIFLTNTAIIYIFYIKVVNGNNMKVENLNSSELP